MKSVTLLLLFTILNFQGFTQTCTFGDCQNAYSIQQLENGNKYLGEFQDGKRHGQGVMFYTNGTKYVGSWKANLRNGEGRIYKNERLVKSGIWQNNHLTVLSYIQNGCLTGDCMNGYGIYLFQDGRKIYGAFESGIIKNFGVCYYPNGSKYIGHWEKQMRQNTGIYYSSNGEVQKGIWKADKFVVETPHADKKGCMSGNCVDGKGIIKYDNHGLYQGYFFTEKADGFGVYHYPNGDIYVGEWLNQRYHGLGTMYHNDGSIVKGNWKNGFFKSVLEKNLEIAYDFTENQKQGKVWVLLVGVSEYQELNNLKYTDNDAFKLNAFFQSTVGGALPDEQIRILIDEEATQIRILKELQLMARKAEENDLILFYFSGHGFVGSFVPHDYRQGSDILINHNELIAILEGSKAKSKVIIADACHAGSLDTKDASPSSLINTYYNAFRKSTGGTVLLLSSKADEISVESQGLKQGLYSHFLLQGLKGKANKNNDNVITVSELHQYIYSNVKFVTSGKQTPVIHGNFDIHMPLSVIDK